MLLTYLQQNYSPGEPIFLSDISIPEISGDQLRWELDKLTESCGLGRFEADIYYFPEQSLLGGPRALNPERVAFHKYIRRRGKRIGYFSGYTLMNGIGLSSQVPFVQEITSNLASEPEQKINIKHFKYIIRRPPAEVTDDNAAVLQLLDCLSNLDDAAEDGPDRCQTVLSKFIIGNGITKAMVDKYIVSFPLTAYKAIYDIGLRFAAI